VAVNCLFSRIYCTMDGIKDTTCAGFTRSNARLFGSILPHRFCSILAEGPVVVFCLCCCMQGFSSLINGRIHFCKGILNEALDVFEIFLYSGFDPIQSIICIFDSEVHFLPLFFLWKLICSTCQYGLRLLFISINNP